MRQTRIGKVLEGWKYKRKVRLDGDVRMRK